MKIDLEKLTFIFKGDMKSGYQPPAQQVIPHKVNFKSRKISCELKAPNHRRGYFRKQGEKTDKGIKIAR